MKIVIVDYGAGNLQSVKNALDRLGVPSCITDDKEMILSADKVIFPGQGHFGACIASLKEKGLFDVIREVATTKPFLGICVGMQVLFEKSEEAPGVPGLGVLQGEVKKFSQNQKLPQMGWNRVEEKYFYFANSYYCVPDDAEIIKGIATYGEEFCCIVEKDQLIGVQFHPEKSGKDGMALLEKFVRQR